MSNRKIDFSKKNILITGGAGFIGSNLAFYFQKNFPDANITIIDCFRSNKTFENGNLTSYGHYKNLIGFNGNIICGNLINIDDFALIDKFHFDFIFHHAAISDTRVYNQELILKTNVNSFYKLLKFAKKNNAVMVYASSAALYGNLPAPQTEGDEYPINPYGFSKLMMDQLAEKYSKENPELTIVGLRFFNVYGPGEFYKAKTSSMIIQLAHQILDNKPPRLFENSSQILRDFIFIEDVIKANIYACSSIKNGSYNVATGIARSFVDIVEILQNKLKTNLPIEYFPNPYEGYQSNTQADLTNIKKYLGFEADYSLEKGIEAYLPEILKLHGTNNK